MNFWAIFPVFLVQWGPCPSVAFLEYRGSGMFGGFAKLAVRRMLTGNRAEYFRVVGMHSDG